MSRQSGSTKEPIRTRGGLRFVDRQLQSRKSSRDSASDRRDEDLSDPPPNTRKYSPKKSTDSVPTKGSRPNAERSKKRVRFGSNDLIKSVKNTIAKYTERVDRQGVDQSRRFLYRHPNNTDEQPILQVQTQEELIRNLPLSSVKSLVRDEFFTETKHISSRIEPRDVHLLTAKEGRITYNLAEYISTKMVGRKAVTTKEHTLVPSNVTPAKNAALDALRQVCNVPEATGRIVYPRCKSKSHKQRPVPRSLLEPTDRPLRCYQPSQRRLWVINQACVKKFDANRNEQDRSSATTTQASQARSTARFKQARVSRKQKRAKFSKPSTFSLGQVTTTDPTQDFDETYQNLMFDELETLDDEEELQPEEELFTMLQADVEDNWEALSQTRQAKRKSTHLFNAPKHLGGHSSFSQGSVDPLNMEHFGLLSNIQLFDTQALTMGLQNQDGRACIRRLIQLIAAESSPKSLYEKYMRHYRITSDLEHTDLVQNHRPGILQEIANQAIKVFGQDQVVLNDHTVMEKLEDRIREIHRNRLAEIEANLERKEAERVRTLLMRNLIDLDVLDAELLRHGELMHAKRRVDPTILLHKVSRGKHVFPVFCLNPLKEEYKFCHMDQEFGILNQVAPRAAKTSITSSSHARKSNRGKSIIRKRQSDGPESIDMKVDLSSTNVPTMNFEESDSTETPVQLVTDKTPNQTTTHHLPHLPLALPSLDSCLKSQTEMDSLLCNDNIVKLYRAARVVLRRGIDAEISSSILEHVQSEDSSGTMQHLRINTSQLESGDSFDDNMSNIVKTTQIVL